MAKYFTSVLKLVESPPDEQRTGVEEVGVTEPPVIRMQVDENAEDSPSNLSLHLPEQPHPQKSCSQPVSLNFDKILLPDVLGAALYKQTAREVVESTLLGYHGTVITLSSSKTKKEQSDFVWCPSSGAVRRATGQILRCLKKSRDSKSASNLVILCSYVAVVEEEVRDLLNGFSHKNDVGNKEAQIHADLLPLLKVVNKELSGVSQHAIASSREVSQMLRYGKRMERALLGCDAAPPATVRRHHTIFTITVEFSQFGTMNAPVSGNLQFVDLAASDPLAERQKFTRGERIDALVLSLFAFADVVKSLSSNVAVLEAANTANSAFSMEMETPSFLPHIPVSGSCSDPHEKSVLTQLLREALGGNCKTLLVTYAPIHPLLSSRSELMETLKIASRARIIQNTPNKRDLAEKALMSAYLRGLEEMYGRGAGGSKEEVKTQLVEGSVMDFGDSGEEGEGGEKTKQVDNLSRQRNMEMAATALVAAALEEKDEDSEDSGSDMENEGSFGASSNSERRLTRRKSRAQSLAANQGVMILLNEEQNVTLKTLVAILQDPDHGVSRPSAEDLSHVKVKKDAGALFSGAAITQWLMTNISGVRSDGDAEILGQMLLDSGHIFHSEGSRVFASAETLFYHARYARTNHKSLSLDEIMALLNAASSQEQEPNQKINAEKESTCSMDMNLTDIENVDWLAEGSVRSAGDENTLSRDQVLAAASLPHDKRAAKHGTTKLELKDVENFSEEPDGKQVEFKEGASAGADDGFREEWMTAQDSGDEDNELKEEEVTNPNTAPLRKLPTLQTLESCINYPHPLHMAVAIGKTPAVVRELVMMFGVNQLDASRRTPLMFAALGDNKGSSCNTLLNCAAELDLQDVSGLTALHVACYHGSKSATRALLARKASIALKDKLGHSALHWSMVPSDPGGLQLLTHGFSRNPSLINHADSNGLTAMHWSIFYDHSQHLNLLLRRCRKGGLVDLTGLDSKGRTLAIYAIEKQSPSCLKVLLNASPSLLTLPDHQGSTPLHHATIQDSTDCLHTLLGYVPPKGSVPLDVNHTDLSQWTCLHYAVAYYNLECVSLLVGSGAGVSVEDREGKTVLDYASDLSEGREQMLAILKGKEVFTKPEEVCEATSTDGKASEDEAATNKDSSSSDRRSKVCTLL